jgi:hypothetical protein
VYVFQTQSGASRDTLLMHQARHVGRCYVFGAVAKMIVSLLQSHPGGDGFVRNAEGASETAAVVRPIYGYKH